jgi:Na+/H+ antiporter NhaC
MELIDYIYYSATTTDASGTDIITQAQYFIPFFDFLMLAIVFAFTILFLWFFKDALFPKKNIFVKYKYIIKKKKNE